MDHIEEIKFVVLAKFIGTNDKDKLNLLMNKETVNYSTDIYIKKERSIYDIYKIRQEILKRKCLMDAHFLTCIQAHVGWMCLIFVLYYPKYILV